MTSAWKIAFALVGIFVAGLVAGSLATVVVVRKMAERRAGQSVLAGERSVEMMAVQQLRRVGSALDLSEDQRRRLDPVLRGAGEELRALRRGSLRETMQILQRAERAIEAELTPEQRQRFEEMMRQRREQWRRRASEAMAGPGPGRNPGGEPPPPGRRGP